MVTETLPSYHPSHEKIIRHLKNAFGPNLCVGSEFQIFYICQYAPQGHFLRGACGLKHGSALTLNPNPIFEIAPTYLNSDL